MIFPALAFGQMRSYTVTVAPVLGPVSVDSLTWESGNDTLKFFRDMDTPQHLVAAMVGERILCVDSTNRILWNTTVLSIVDSNQLVMSDTSQGDDSLGTAQIGGVFGAVAYSSGDMVGFIEGPFYFQDYDGLRRRTYARLTKVVAADSSDQGANFDVLILAEVPNITADNVAYAAVESKGFGMAGAVTVDSWVDYGGTDWATETPNYYMPDRVKDQGFFYVAIVSKGTPTYTALTDLRIEMTFLSSR
jgi:hypothetical protein